MKYVFTVTLRPEHYKKNIQLQFAEAKDWFDHVIFFGGRNGGFKSSVVAEIDHKGDVHFHGLVEIPFGNLDRFINRFRHKHVFRFFGRKDVTQVVDEPVWIEYLRKDLRATYLRLKHNPIVYDDFKLFTDFRTEIEFEEEVARELAKLDEAKNQLTAEEIAIQEEYIGSQMFE